MDDSCAVCADTLEWVAYGPCGHREVCSTCVARLRFICDDRRCCICKTECNFVFVTKALGDYTKMISDFSTLPSEVREGQVGSYWYHEDTQAFFDDVDHYKMIKAMCRLSCSVCDKMEEQQHHDGHRRRTRFRNIGQLKGHLIHQHKLFMCNLCLEGRKVFICEQKLYTRSQLNQHMRTGDSVVDGTESERGGFAGHPMCQFCRDSFYGDNELYSHMSTEHFTCHICQRQHPGQYEYYRDYNDLEMHFRRDHFLCEDEACLAKKFIVFPSEQELKRHNALEHGGRMSRSKRNAVLQIPTSFTYRSSNESGNRRGRGRTFRREFDDEDNQLNMAIQASIDFASRGDRFPDPPSSSARASRDDADPSDVDPLIQPFESLATAESEPSSRYRQAVSHSSSVARLGESSFPPLSATHSQQKSEHETDGSRQETMAARLSRRDNVSVLNAANLRQNRTQGPAPSAPWPMMNNTQAPMSGPGQIRPTSDGSGLSGYASSLQGRLPWGLRNPGTSGRLNHSALAPNLAESKSFDPVSDFPPVSAAQSNRVPSGSQGVKTKDIQSANKTLVEKIRAALGNDEDKYTTFKVISQEYRQGIIDTWDYLGYVKQFGLSHLVPDLARLCPDTLKQKELVATYIATLQSNGSLEALQGNVGSHSRESGSSRKKEKGKNMLDGDSNSSKETLADSVLATVRRLQSDQKPFGGEVEVLSKDDYRATKGKSLGTGTMQNDRYLAVGNGTSQALGDGGGGSKQKKKTSKFHRVRLGESSAVLDLRSSNADPSPNQAGSVTDVSDPSQALPVRSAWRSGGGQKLFRR